MNRETGRALWILLHAYAKCYPVKASKIHQDLAGQWLKIFTAVVEENSSNCQCSKKWQQVLQLCPPVLTGRADFSLWGIVVHDWVNQKLGKPLRHPKLTLQHPLFGAH